MTAKKTILTITILTFFLGALQAEIKISDSAEKEINSFMELRVKLSIYENSSDALDKITEYENSKQPVYSALTKEEQLILENLILMERYNYMVYDKASKDFLKTSLFALVEKNESLLKSTENPNYWMYVIAADCMSCYMYFEPIKGAVKYGTKIKDYYEKSLELSPENSYCITHLAQWYYWAPGIAGGGKKKALSYFEKGLENAKTDSERYYAYIYISQVQYELDEKELCNKNLSEAEKIMPQSMYIREIRDFNQNGYSLFTGNRKKAEDSGIKTQ